MLIFDLSNISVCNERLTCSDFDKRLTPKSPISFPLISKRRNCEHMPSSLIKSFKFDLSLQSISHKDCRVEFFDISHLVNA